jgi:hypothetical protein
MNKRKYMRRIAASMLILIIPFFLFANYDSECKTSYVYYTIFGGGILNRNSFIIAYLIMLLPFFLVIFSFIEFFKDDYLYCCVYIFTRTEKRYLFFLKKAAWLLLFISLFFIAGNVLLFIVIKILGIETDAGPTLAIVLISFVLNVLITFDVLLALNMAAIKKGTAPTFLVGTAAFILMIAAAVYSKTAAMILPASQGFFAFHDNPFTAQQIFVESVPYAGFGVVFSIVYLIVLAAAEIAVYIFIFNKMDLLGISKGEE